MSRPTIQKTARLFFYTGRTLRLALAAGLLLAAASSAAAQSPAPSFGECKTNAAAPAGAPAKEEAPAAEAQASGLRIEVKGADGKPLRRERFYLLTRGVKDAGGIDWAGAPARADFLKDASPELRQALDSHDCDTLYCPELVNEYPKLVESVPEFRQAFEAGMRKYRNRRLALEWLPVNFPRKNVRTGYYERKRAWLKQAAQRAGAVVAGSNEKGEPVFKSVMTNEEGEAIFTGVTPGAYHVSNLIPAGAGRLVWDCQVTVPPPSKKELHSASVVMSAAKAAPAAGASK